MKFRRLNRLIILLSILILSGSTFFFARKDRSSSAELLTRMTLEERYYLDAFLRNLLFVEDFSYVLFGSKPMSFTSYEKYVLPFNVSYDYVSASNLKIKKGLEVFKKYQHFFSSSNIDMRFFDDPEDLVLVMINKKNFLHVFNKYQSDFKQVFGPKINGEDYLSQFIGKGDHRENAIKNEAILGMILGYGKGNALLFHKKRTLMRELKGFNLSLKQRRSREEELAEINQHFGRFSLDLPRMKPFPKKLFIPLPGFVADPDSEETQELKERYGKDRKKMMKIFAKRGFLEATLHQLMDK